MFAFEKFEGSRFAFPNLEVKSSFFKESLEPRFCVEFIVLNCNFFPRCARKSKIPKSNSPPTNPHVRTCYHFSKLPQPRLFLRNDYKYLYQGCWAVTLLKLVQFDFEVLKKESFTSKGIVVETYGQKKNVFQVQNQ